MTNKTMTNPRISEIVTRFKGKTFSSNEQVIDWLTTTLEAFEKETEKQLAQDIRNWTKGKTVTKDKLRNYLNQIIKESEE